MVRVKPAGEKTKQPLSAAGWQTTDIRSAGIDTDMTPGFIADRFGKDRLEAIARQIETICQCPADLRSGHSGRPARRRHRQLANDVCISGTITASFPARFQKRPEKKRYPFTEPAPVFSDISSMKKAGESFTGFKPPKRDSSGTRQQTPTLPFPPAPLIGDDRKPDRRGDLVA